MNFVKEILEATVAKSPPTTIAVTKAASSRSIDGWVFSSAEILRVLEDENSTWDDRLTAVFFAETTAFADSQKPQPARPVYWGIA